ncbi:MAG: efflux RND transporter permease subunit [Bacteroidales bacterium]|nr:efflux RND transporter permease subunit [Bacteroidales bacterium]
MKIIKRDFISSMMRNHQIVFLILGIFMLFGVYALINMKKQEFPEFTIRQGVVAAVYPGATSSEIEQQVTKPLENFLFTYSEVDQKKTYSYSQNGIVYIFVTLDDKVNDKDEVWSKIRHGLKDFKMMLPAGVLAVVVNDDFGETSALLVTIGSTDKTYRELESYMKLLCDQLRTIDAMGNLKTFGAVHEEISVYIEQEKLASYGITSSTLMANILSQGFLTTSGTLENADISEPIHIKNVYQSEKELEEQIIYADPNGNIVRLKDIARIERNYEKPDKYIRQDGNKVLLLSMEMQPGNNIVKFGNDVEKVLNEFQKTLPQSVVMQRVSDLPKVVEESVTSFLRDLVTAMIIVILVMLLLFPLRSALVSAAAIPVTIFLALGIMYLFGMELNTVTLAALIVVLGMIVDNSVVVIDGYSVLQQKNYSRWYSAVYGTRDYLSSLIMATVAITLIFFPFLFTLTGALKDFIQQFPWTIGLTLFLSLALAIIMTPYLEFVFLKKPKGNIRPSKFSKVQERFFNSLQQGYEWLLKRCFKYPAISISIALVSIGLSLLFLLIIPIQLMPAAERDCFALEIHLNEGSTIEETVAVCDSIENILKNDQRVVSQTVFIGNSSPRFMATYAPNMPGKNFAQFIVNTISNQASVDLLHEYAPKYTDYFPNAVIRFKQMDYQAVKNPVEVRFTGEDMEALQIQVDKMKDFLYSIEDNVSWIHTDYPGTVSCVQVELDPVESSRLGVTKSMLSIHLASAFGGMPLTTIWEDDYDISVKLRMDRNGNFPDYEDIGNQLIATAIPGVTVPLRQIATIQPAWEPAQIAHFNGVKTITVACDLDFGVSQPKVMKKINQYIEEELRPSLPEGVSVYYGGLTEVNEETMPGIISGLVAAVFIIFLFLVFTFNKISTSLLALSSTLLCLLGAFFGLWVFGLDIGITSILGIVSLIGVIVRNAIIMFDYAELLRVHQRFTAREAAYESGKRRMRPIFLTSATTAVGVIPMIISKSTLWMPMGIVICFGTIFAMILVVTILPVAYWMIYSKKGD